MGISSDSRSIGKIEAKIGKEMCRLHRLDLVAESGSRPQSHLKAMTLLGVGVTLVLAGVFQNTLRGAALVSDGVGVKLGVYSAHS